MYKSLKIKIVTFLLVITYITTPIQLYAITLFGGQITNIMGCVNDVTYVDVGPPNGGAFLWSPTVTTTYQFGQPSHTGQWLMGLADVDYYCLFSIIGPVVFPGEIMIMMGSSQ